MKIPALASIPVIAAAGVALSNLPEQTKIITGALTVASAVVGSVIAMYLNIKKLSSPSPGPTTATNAEEHVLSEHTLNQRIKDDAYTRLADYVRDEFLVTRQEQRQIRDQMGRHEERLQAFEREWRTDREQRDSKLDRIFSLIGDRPHLHGREGGGQ